MKHIHQLTSDKNQVRHAPRVAAWDQVERVSASSAKDPCHQQIVSHTREMFFRQVWAQIILTCDIEIFSRWQLQDIEA